MSLRVAETLAGKRLLVTGLSGFLGKVWLAHLLEALGPRLGRVTALLRPARRGGATGRLEELLATSPAFWPLHERHGAGLGAALGPVLDAVAGDVSRPALGLGEAELAALEGRLDLVVHLAGLTDLDPDPRQALAANVTGAREALAVARRTGAALLHVSTAYVAGRRRGEVPERLAPDYVPAPPAGLEPFRAPAELAALEALLERVAAEVDDPGVAAALVTRAREQQARHGEEGDPAALAGFLERERERWLRERLRAAGQERARAWGWPNFYTLTKSLAESLLLEERGEVPLCVVRPTIVESALEFPFPGWKEGHQTSAPLVWAMTRGPLRGLPAQRDLRLDVIPVDLVARGLTLAAAALLAGRAPLALHLGSSDRNPLTMERAVELSALAERQGRSPRALADLLRPDPRPCGEQAYRWTSLPLLRRLAGGAEEALQAAGDLLPEGLAGKARRWARRAERARRDLTQLEEVVETFRPFVLENDCTFLAGEAAALTEALAPEERARFGFAPEQLDWRGYWLDVHVPGLRRWVFPRLEGGRAEPLPRRPVTLAPAPVETHRRGEPIEASA